YDFCINSPYYEMLVETVYKEGVVQEIDNVCKSFKNDVCLFEDLPAEEICKKVLYMYKFLDKVQSSQKPPSTITNEDLDFLNYWFNVKLNSKNSNASICISEFYKAIKSEEDYFKSSNIILENRLHVIHSTKLENMKLLYELYHAKQNILDIMLKQDYSDNGESLCPEYLKKCYYDYMQGIDKCLNDYGDFCKAIKKFKYDYKYGIEEVPDKSEYCNISEYFRLPEYDSAIEKQRKIMTIKILSTPLIMSFVIPLLYKYTPLGPFLRTKINTVKNKWMNSDEYGSELSSLPTDIEDNISDNGEYNIGYYSGIN
ncbi:PIR Superfamily Protein, partial [Plasmodium ovale curtisi]